MYHYLDDKEFLSKMRRLSGEIMQLLCHYLKEDHDIGASFYLVGSGARNLILQNESNPVDLDYNLEIVRCEDFDDCRYLKECANVLAENGIEYGTYLFWGQHYEFAFGIIVLQCAPQNTSK